MVNVLVDLKFIAHFFCKGDLYIKTVEIWAHKEINTGRMFYRLNDRCPSDPV